MKERALPRENKMGVMPVGKLLLNMSLPMMFSMFFMALYNIVDSVFVARINENALTAVSLAFPLQNLMIAVGAGTGVGINALLSKSLGEKNFEQSNKVARNGILLAVFSYLLFLMIGLTAVESFYRSQTDVEEIVRFGMDYADVICILSFGLYTQVVMERILQSTGRTFYTMITQITGALINMIMDPILIFGLLGFPRMGVTGAAVATVMGQIIAGIVATIINIKKNEDIHISFRGFKPDLGIIRKIYGVGLPSIIMVSISSVMVYGMNLILVTFSTTATAVLGVYFKLQSFIFMPVFGLNNGMIPIIAYNYGANNRKRLVRTIQLSVLFAVAIMIVGFAIFQMLPSQLLSIFNASEDMLAMGIPALRRISISFLFAGYSIIVGSVFQALGNGMYSLIISIVRQLVVFLPVAYGLSLFGNVDLVWFAFPIAELVAIVVSTLYLLRINRRIISKLN